MSEMSNSTDLIERLLLCAGQPDDQTVIRDAIASLEAKDDEIERLRDELRRYEEQNETV